MQPLLYAFTVLCCDFKFFYC